MNRDPWTPSQYQDRHNGGVPGGGDRKQGQKEYQRNNSWQLPVSHGKH